MQATQISFLDDDSLTVAEVATAMAVSEASVRNWIKTGYLQLTGRNRISRSSLNTFRDDIVGTHKLTARANKSQVDQHDHSELANIVSELLSQGNHTADHISDIYEHSLSQSHKNVEGVYYTPSEICDSFFLNLPGDRSKQIFLDPCCGTGNFLLAALRAGFQPHNIYGCDVDSLALNIARKRIYEATAIHSKTIFSADFIGSLIDVKRSIPTPDVIFTNPPWGKKLSSIEKDQLSSLYNCNKSIDTSGYFLLACQNILSPGGYYGLLLPDAFFNVASFESARRSLLADQVISITDHGKPFAGLLTRAVSFVAIKHPPEPRHTIRCSVAGRFAVRDQWSFLSNPSMILNYAADADDAATIQYIYSIDHITLRDNAKWALGIVTGNNKRHLSATPKRGFVPIYRGSDIGLNSLKSPTNFVSTDTSDFQQVAPKELYQAKEKLIYRFISSRLVFYYDTEQSMILNSANLVIPDHSFPVSMRLLAQYLSSEFMNWIYGTIFSTHKVLRSDIERLPIFADHLAMMDDFDEARLLKTLGLTRTGDGSYRIKK